LKCDIYILKFLAILIQVRIKELRYYQRKKQELNGNGLKAGMQRWRDRGGRARAHRVIEFFFSELNKVTRSW